jgi:hypothetical protein
MESKEQSSRSARNSSRFKPNIRPYARRSPGEAQTKLEHESHELESEIRALRARFEPLRTQTEEL